jgi:uncharacterized protein YjbI with pentapeptide repeats
MALLFKIQQHLKDQPNIQCYLQTQGVDSTFYPCGKPETQNFKPTCLLQLVSYSQSIKAPNLELEPKYDEFKDDALNKDISLSPSPFEDVLWPFLKGANLKDLNLVGTSFRNVILQGADLSGTAFIQSNLSCAVFEEADLTSAKLRRANLRKAVLTKAQLKEANLDSADLNGAKLVGANLERASLPRAYLLYADLSNACLRNADLRGAILERANLCGASLQEANLNYASFRRADLRGADLTGAQLYGANFVNAIVAEANFTGIRWDDDINWFGAKGLHRVKPKNSIPSDLNAYPPFVNARSLSEAIEQLVVNFCPASYNDLLNVYVDILGESPSGEVLNEEVCRSISKRLKAALWNKFCWLCTLFGFADEPKVIAAGERTLALMEDLKREDADYLDTVGVNLLMRKNIEEAAEKFNQVVTSEYRKNWTYKLIQRRENWLVFLRNGRNPFTEKPDWLEELKREEYPLEL